MISLGLGWREQNSMTGDFDRTMMRWAIAAAVVTGVLAAPAKRAEAVLMGATVDVAAFFPNTSSVYDDPGSRVVNGSVEYPFGSYSSYASFIAVEVTDHQMFIGLASDAHFAPAAFNGFILDVLSGPTITSASAGGASSFSPVSVTLIGGNEVQVNYAGLFASAGTSVINLGFAPTPEPSGFALAIIGGPAAIARAKVRRRVAPRTKS
jgi:hypothetical protein